MSRPRSFMPVSRREPVPFGTVPLVGQGQPPAYPPGRYRFHVAVIVKRDGRFDGIDNFTLNYDEPKLAWAAIENACVQYADILLARKPDQPKPSVKPLSWQFIDFTPQEVVEKVKALEAATVAAEKAEAEGADDAEQLREVADDLAEELGLARVKPAEPPAEPATEGGETA